MCTLQKTEHEINWVACLSKIVSLDLSCILFPQTDGDAVTVFTSDEQYSITSVKALAHKNLQVEVNSKSQETILF